MKLPVAQGVYFLLTGIWPLLSMRTFEAVTGPKVDRRLVKTVGVLVAVIGSKIYLADAVIEALLVGLWGRRRCRRRLIS